MGHFVETETIGIEVGRALSSHMFLYYASIATWHRVSVHLSHYDIGLGCCVV